MADTILLSVVIAAYNCASTLTQCVESICNSGKIADKSNYEIIIVNDGSTDDTNKIIKQCCHEQAHIRAATQTNQGASAARNAGVSLARGAYVSFVDSDDYVDEEYLAVLLPILEEGSYDCVLFGTRTIALNGKATQVGAIPNRPRVTDSRGFFKEILDPCSGYQGFVCSKAIRRGLFWRNGSFFGFDTSIEILEDEWLWLNLAPRCMKVYLCERSLYNYRIRLDSTTSEINAKGGWDDLDMRDRIVEYASSACPEHAELARWRRRLKTCSMVRRFYVSGDKEALKRLRPRWRDARNSLYLISAPIGLIKRLQVTLCDFAMTMNIPVGALAPFRCLLARGNDRLRIER